MPKKYIPFQEHYSYRIFAKLHAKNIRDLAVLEQQLSSDLRLFFLGLGRVSNKGHATFNKGELTSLMGTEDRNLRKIIRKLVSAKALSQESSLRCLVYPSELVSLSILRGSDLCPEHGTHRSWSNALNNWVDDYPPTVSRSGESAENTNDIEEPTGPFEEFENHFMGTFSS
jgi:hypothetical protein